MPDPTDQNAFPGTGSDAPAWTQNPDPRARLEELLASEFVAKARVAPAQAQLQAKWLVDSTVISARIASHALPADQLKAFQNIFAERALEESFAEMPTPTAKAAAHEILIAENNYDYRSLYQAAQDVPLPPLSEGNQLHPFVSYVFETGSSKFKHEAGSLALKKFAGTESGQKVVKAALNNPVTKEAAKKLLTQLGVKAATTAATGAGGAAAGAEAGAAAGAPGGPLAIVTAIVGAVIGFVVGAVVGNWSKVKHEAEEGILALSAAVYSVGSTIFSGGVAAVGAIFAAIGTVAVESATSIVVIVLAVPIVLAFMLYIISNSAYIVPPSSTIFVPGTGPGDQGGFENRSGCPLASGQISTLSYDSAFQDGRGSVHRGGQRHHGTNGYWLDMGGSPCRYHMPADGVTCGPNYDPVNICYNQANWNGTCASGGSLSPFYGYAIDVVSSSNNVYLPLVNGQSLTWNYGGSPYNTSAGYAQNFSTTDPGSGDNYFLHFMHMNSTVFPGPYTSGKQVGTLYNQGGNTHLHLEFSVNGVLQKPENYFCR